ncbi:hypothetical protein BpHYR1_043381 [Brachionus plicatilis]|uniref:EGF-like domain-containing protein n=1 Tax=Brachionus plicatilis TaxID=10195 RepID=A0A3M7QWC1_BRAPC|nr:hypothetical protein BpHYR1_043381 [Brachionus plicatilis]
MICLKKFVFWLTVSCVCYCQNQVDNGCYSENAEDCAENATESVQVPERFDFVARMVLLQENSTVENTTEIAPEEQFVRDIEIEDEIDVLNATEIELEVADYNSTYVPVVVRSAEILVENQTVNNLNLTENQTVEVVRDLDFENETLVQAIENSTEILNETVARVARDVGQVDLVNSTECENSTEILNETVARVARDVGQVDLVNSTECENSTEILNETVARVARNVDQVDLVNSTEFENKTIVVPNVDARNFGNECRGVGSCVKGVCDKYSQTFNCICQPDYEGATCDKKFIQDKYFEDVLNRNFSLEKFLNETFYNSTAGYDELVINLVDKLWSEINPEENYVHLFNYFNLTQYASVGQEVQKLLLFSKISLFELEDRMKVYEQVLDGLIEIFEKCPIKEEAVRFVDEWEKSVNQDKVETVGRHVVSPVLIESVQSALNETYYLVRELVDVYEAYLVLNETVKFEKMDQLISSTDKSWVKVIEYGFWHITGQLVGKDESYFINKTSISAKRSLPKGALKVKIISEN